MASVSRQRTCMVSALLALLDDLPSDFAQLSCPYPHWPGQPRAGVEVRTNAVGQVCATTRAKMRVVVREIGSKFMLPEAFGARATVRNRLAWLSSRGLRQLRCMIWWLSSAMVSSTEINCLAPWTLRLCHPPAHQRA